jgi:hypothetical protein
MKLLEALLATGAIALAACTALFEDPVQCKNDGDCARFEGTFCGADGTCVPNKGPASEGTPGSTTPSTAPGVGPDGGPIQPAISCPPLGERKKLPFPGAAPDAGGLGEIAQSASLECTTTYALHGIVVVRAGATLTIQAGTQIEGDTGAALVIAPGAKIVATGTRDLPIVFTSAAATKAPGDWRGLSLLGKAPPAGDLNGVAYGGDVDNDSSGSLQYVRVEYATRGLELLSVGNGTTVDGVQVRKANDNCFTITGGRVDLKRLVCQYPADEMFEFTNGYSGRAQFLVGQRTPTTGAGHHGLLVDGSTLTLANATLCGADAPNQGIGLLLRNNAAPSFQSVIVRGFDAGFDVLGARGTPFELKGSVLNGNLTENVAYEEGGSADPASPLFDDDQGFDERAFFADPARKNSEANPGLDVCFDAKTPIFAPNAPAAVDAPPSDGFFEAGATYAGAVGKAADDWTKAAWLRWSAD